MASHFENNSINRAREVVYALINSFQDTEYNLGVNNIRLREICSEQGVSPQQTEQLAQAFAQCLQDLSALNKFNKNLIALGVQLDRLDTTIAGKQVAA